MAAITLCVEGEVTGIVVTKTHTVEVLPMRLSDGKINIRNATTRGNNLHLVKKIKEVEMTENVEEIQDRQFDDSDEGENNFIQDITNTTNQPRKILEVALFLDSLAYKR